MFVIMSSCTVSDKRKYETLSTDRMRQREPMESGLKHEEPGQQTTSLLPQKRQRKDYIRTPGITDILLGRGKDVQDHTGNFKMRELVKGHQAHYCSLPRTQRRDYAEKVLDEILDEGARFLKRRSDRTKRYLLADWEEAERSAALSKVSHLLREKRKKQVSVGCNSLMVDSIGVQAAPAHSIAEVDQGVASLPQEQSLESSPSPNTHYLTDKNTPTITTHDPTGQLEFAQLQRGPHLEPTIDIFETLIRSLKYGPWKSQDQGLYQIGGQTSQSISHAADVTCASALAGYEMLMMSMQCSTRRNTKAEEQYNMKK